MPYIPKPTKHRPIKPTFNYGDSRRAVREQHINIHLSYSYREKGCITATQVIDMLNTPNKHSRLIRVEEDCKQLRLKKGAELTVKQLLAKITVHTELHIVYRITQYKDKLYVIARRYTTGTWFNCK